MEKLFCLICLSFAALSAFAQTTETSIPLKKNFRTHQPDSSHSPALAFKRSAMVPGWGQVYNRKWWKVPLVYGGLAGFGYGYLFNRGEYRAYLRVYNLKKTYSKPLTTDSENVKALYTWANQASLPQIESGLNYHQRNLQLSLLGFAGFWGLQIIDSYIDAKFMHSYSIDRDLSFNVAPGIQSAPMYAANNISSVMPVIKVTFTVK